MRLEFVVEGLGRACVLKTDVGIGIEGSVYEYFLNVGRRIFGKEYFCLLLF